MIKKTPNNFLKANENKEKRMNSTINEKKFKSIALIPTVIQTTKGISDSKSYILSHSYSHPHLKPKQLKQPINSVTFRNGEKVETGALRRANRTIPQTRNRTTTTPDKSFNTPSSPSSGFLLVLNSNASVIQRWYRSIKLRETKLSSAASKKESKNKSDDLEKVEAVEMSLVLTGCLGDFPAVAPSAEPFGAPVLKQNHINIQESCTDPLIAAPKDLDIERYVEDFELYEHDEAPNIEIQGSNIETGITKDKQDPQSTLSAESIGMNKYISAIESDQAENSTSLKVIDDEKGSLKEIELVEDTFTQEKVVDYNGLKKLVQTTEAEEDKVDENLMDLKTKIIDSFKHHASDSISPLITPILDEKRGEILISEPIYLSNNLELADFSPKVCKVENGQSQTRAKRVKEISEIDVALPSKKLFNPDEVRPFSRLGPHFTRTKSTSYSQSQIMELSLGQDKLQDSTCRSVSRILSYLESVQQDPITQHVSPFESYSGPSFQDLVPSAQPPQLFNEIKTKLQSNQLEIEMHKKTIKQLSLQLTQQLSSHKETLLETTKSHSSQMKLLRKEYEAIVSRHLKFIDEVVREKEELTNNVGRLTITVSKMEKAFHSKTVELEDKQIRELGHQKEIWQQQEKSRREKWINEKTRLIKEQTINGLEPEIQKLIASHKTAQRQMEENYHQQLAKERQTLHDQHQLLIENLREKTTTERQKACEEEREFARQRYAKLLEREEESVQMQKRKMYSDFEQEKEGLAESHRLALSSCEKRHHKEIEKMYLILENTKHDHEEQVTAMNSKHDSAMTQLRARLEVEKEEWQANFIKKTEQTSRAREKAFREQMIIERDQEIEMVVVRLESEGGSNNSDATRRYRMDIERIKAEMAIEVKGLRDQHSLALDKLIVANNRIQVLESELREAQKEALGNQHALIAKESLLKCQKEEIARLGSDEQVLISQIQHDFEDEIIRLKKELELAQDTLHNERIKAASRVNDLTTQSKRLQNEKEEMMEKVEAQILLSLASKDKVISQLQSKVQEERHKMQHLETMMQDQRDELLGVKSLAPYE